MKEFRIIKEFNANTGVNINSQNKRILWTKELISPMELADFHYSPYTEDKFAVGLFEISSIDKINVPHILNIDEKGREGYLHEYRYFTYCD